MEVLPAGCTIVLELHRLICDVTSSSGNRIGSILYPWLFCRSWSYCEKIDNEVVVEVMSISSVIEMSSIFPAALVVISS